MDPVSPEQRQALRTVSAPEASSESAAAAGLGVDEAGAPSGAADLDRELVAALRRGEERVFLRLFEELHPRLVEVARGYVSSRELAEEVAQDTWLALHARIDGFQFRSRLRTWIFAILIRMAKKAAARERRHARPANPDAGASPSARSTADAVADRRDLDTADRSANPERQLMEAETTAVVRAAIGSLPPMHQAVLTLRDVQGCSAPEVCDLLDLTPANQRVLLHRARTRVREALASLLGRRR
jgi:RNA polymerase sigma-70 factor (ECF subfamily)